jgi:hypothetical protein
VSRRRRRRRAEHPRLTRASADAQDLGTPRDRWLIARQRGTPEARVCQQLRGIGCPSRAAASARQLKGCAAVAAPAGDFREGRLWRHGRGMVLAILSAGRSAAGENRSRGLRGDAAMAGEIFHVPRTAEDRPHRDPYAAVLHRGDPRPETPEDRLDRAVETAVERAIFGGSELARRHGHGRHPPAVPPGDGEGAGPGGRRARFWVMCRRHRRPVCGPRDQGGRERYVGARWDERGPR